MRGSLALNAVRYGLPALMVLAGCVVLVVDVGPRGIHTFAMLVGGGIAVALINFVFRLGATGDLERQREQAARDFFTEHGYWPDEAPERERS